MLRIKSVEDKDITALSRFCENSVLGTKIMCQVTAYGLERDFLSVWCCVDDDECIVAVICKFEGNITLLCSEKDFNDDIKLFTSMIGYDSLSAPYDVVKQMNEADITVKNAYIYTGSYDGDVFSELGEEYYIECYKLISRNIPDSFTDTKEAYLFFLSDFTFRKRRGLARLKGFVNENTVLSCALTSAETSSAAIISGVACEQTHRSSGLGKKTVLSLAEELKKEKKAVYVIALNENAEGFYEHIGFEFKEKISFIERK